MDEIPVLSRRFYDWSGILSFEDSIKEFYDRNKISYRVDVFYNTTFSFYRAVVVIDTDDTSRRKDNTDS